MSNLSVFNFDSNEVRVIPSDNPLFAAKDVAAALGYSDPTRAVRQHCKGRVKRTPLKTTSGKQQIRVIYEPDVYRLIFGSKLEAAQRFQDWVFEEVLPSIRKTGRYSLTINLDQQQTIKEIINRIANETGKNYGELYARLHNKFRIPRYQELPAARFDEAVAYLHAKLPPAQMFHGLRDGRYLLVVDGGKTSIMDAGSHSLVNGNHVNTLRRNCRMLTRQMRACFGEADEKTMELSFDALPEVTLQ